MADRTDYPLTVAFLGGSHRHRARWAPDGDTVQTACGRRGEPTSNGAGRPWCPDCPTTPTPYRVLVTGSRDWDDASLVHAALFVATYRRPSAVIVHGACRTGADAIAAAWARQRSWLAEERHPADRQPHGRAAGPRRNAEMVRLGADLCLAFIRNGSRGATHTADLAERAGIETRRFTA